MDEIKIRPLTVGDNRILQNLMERFVEDSKNKWLTTMVKPESKNTGDTEGDGGEMISFFVDIFQDIFTKYRTDATEWFADLIGVTVEKYKAMPFNTDMVIIDQIKEADEFKDFFTRACLTFKLKRFIGNISEKLKGALGSTIV